MNENKQNGQGDLPSEITLGINSLHNQPLLIIVPESALSADEPGAEPEISYDFIYKLDSVLRSLKSIVPDAAYQHLDAALNIKKGRIPAKFWHQRHWDDRNGIATFIVVCPDNHESTQLAGQHLLATSRNRMLTSPCLAPQVAHKPAIMVLIDLDGNMVLPFDEPINEDGKSIPLGAVYLPISQFTDQVQAESARETLAAFDYLVELR